MADQEGLELGEFILKDRGIVCQSIYQTVAASQSQPILACKTSEVGRNNFSGFAGQFNILTEQLLIYNIHDILFVFLFVLFLWRFRSFTLFNQWIYSDFVLAVTPNHAVGTCGLWFHHRWQGQGPSLCIYFSKTVSLSPCAATCHGSVLHSAQY